MLHSLSLQKFTNGCVAVNSLEVSIVPQNLVGYILGYLLVVVGVELRPSRVSVPFLLALLLLLKLLNPFCIRSTLLDDF